MHALPAPDDWRAPHGTDAPAAAAARRSLDAALADLARTSPLDYEAGGQRWHAPRSVAELVAACAARPDARIVAGATDVALWVTKEHRALGDIVYVGDVAELRRIERTAAGWSIGAGASLGVAFDALDRDFPELHEAWVRFASPPIRASGTLGGNVANGSPIGDSMPALIALGAEVELASSAGSRRVPLDAFYPGYRKTTRAPGEVLVAIHVPARAPHLLLRAYKVSKRRDQDISGVFACFALVRDGGRIAAARIGCGGVAAVPARARRTEALLTGATFDAATLARAAAALADEFTPLDDMRASAAYRRTVLGNLLRRLWLEASQAGAPVRVEAVTAP
jgi:xanthine dehydrogenase small subunit